MIRSINLSSVLEIVPILPKLSYVSDLIEIDKIQYCNVVFKLQNWNKLLEKKKNDLPLYFWEPPFVKKLQNSWKTWFKSSILQELNFAKSKNYGNSQEQKFRNSNFEILIISGKAFN